MAFQLLDTDRFGFVDGDGKVIYYTTATDTDGDGYEDNYPLEPDQILNAPQEIRDSVANIRKDTFRVEFNACSSEGSIERYEWIMDGVARPPVSDCLTSIELREGTYKVQLRVSDLSFSHTTPETEVIVQDFLVVALGDSYASGEGAPEKPLSENYWQDLVSLQQAVRNLTQEFNIDNIALTAAEEAAARIQR